MADQIDTAVTHLTRRELLVRSAAIFVAPAQPSTAVNFDVPPNGCDCHVHVFGDPQRYPFTATRTYTPEPATTEELQRLLRALHLTRVVVVQPSVYGTDNTCTLDAIKQLGSRARGISVIDDRTPDAALDEMHRGGIRGIRINLETAGVTDPAESRRRLRAAFDRLRGRPWHVQINTRLSVIEAVREEVAAAPVPVVFDHFGGAQAALGTSQPGFATLVDLVRSGRAYVKISGAYRASQQTPDYADATSLAKALIAANARRVVWGTDWPHPDSARVAGRKNTDIAPLLQIDDGRILNQLPVWSPTAAERRLILVDNPAQLYGFN